MSCEPSDRGIVTNHVSQVLGKLKPFPENLLWCRDSQVTHIAGHGTGLDVREA